MALREVFKAKSESRAALERLISRMNDDAVGAYLAGKGWKKSQLTGYRQALLELLSAIDGTIRDGEAAVDEERKIAKELRSDGLGMGSGEMAV